MKNNLLRPRRILWMLFISTGLISTEAQVTLDQMIEAAISHAPIRSVADYAEVQNEHVLKSLGARSLPQFVLSGQASYQSDVTQIGTDVPALGIEPLSLDQYKISGELSQVIYDGGTVSALREIQENQVLSEILETKIALEDIREQIILTYFKVLELDSRIEVLNLTKSHLQTSLADVETAVNLGAVLASEAQSLQVAILQLEQEHEGILAMRKAQIIVLEIFTNLEITEDTHFALPEEPSMSTTVSNMDVTNKLFSLQQDAIQLSFDNSETSTRPRFDLFVQGGYGRPGLNFLKNEFDFFYIAGVRARWNISGFYTKNSDREVMLLSKQKIDARKTSHEIKTQTEITQHIATITQMKEFIERDEQIIKLYGAIRQTAEVQLQNGAIKSTELVEKINAENTAKINMAVHELNRKKALYLLEHITGNYSQ